VRELRSRLATFKGSCIFIFVAKKITNFLVHGWPPGSPNKVTLYYSNSWKVRYRGIYVSCFQLHSNPGGRLGRTLRHDVLSPFPRYISSVVDAARNTGVEIASVVADRGTHKGSYLTNYCLCYSRYLQGVRSAMASDTIMP
jgi:hypothetical protein